MSELLIKELGEFIKKSPTAFHTVNTIKEILAEKGFVQLTEREAWKLKPGDKCFVSRNNSSIIAFKIGEKLENYSFHITASHSDSPCFKVKENATVEVNGKYTVLNTEGYGGMICSTWMDRPLSLAGRVIVRDENRFQTKLVDLEQDTVLIPNMSIHINGKVNEGMALNKQIDMLPLFSGTKKNDSHLRQLVASKCEVEEENIAAMDLFLYNREESRVWGADGEFFSAPRIDDLECAFASLKGFAEGGNENNVSVYACFDNEEVGSGTKQGAASTFLYDVLYRINSSLGKREEKFHQAVAGSFMLSCDNAHGVHPNHPEKTDKNNCVYMNEGVVIKSHAQQQYTSDAFSIAVFKEICARAGVPVQHFSNRSDARGGSTLGNIAMTQVSVNTIDIGLAQLAMHSAYETAGTGDISYMIEAVKEFYNCHIVYGSEDFYEISSCNHSDKEI